MQCKLFLFVSILHFSGTAAVGMYGDILASCMRDPSVLIRKHAVFLVTTLIRDEYFKWKGQVMYFFLGALLDPNEGVCEQVHASLLNVLLPKFPNMLINHFVEAMFYLNDVVHPAMAVMIKREFNNLFFKNLFKRKKKIAHWSVVIALHCMAIHE